LGYGLDESAINTIATKWRFAPGTLNGEPVDVQANIQVSFRLFHDPGEVENLVPTAALAPVSAVRIYESSKTAAPAAVPVDQQATKEQLTKLFELMRVAEQVTSLTKMMPALVQQQLTAQIKQMQRNNPASASATEQQQEVFTKVINKFTQRAMELYKFDEMIADMTGLYQKYFTRSDVDGIIAFYSSPVGQHLLDVQPVITQEYLPMVMQRIPSQIKGLTDEMQKELRESIKTNIPSVDKPIQR
jgi:uncharacterized protein